MLSKSVSLHLHLHQMSVNAENRRDSTCSCHSTWIQSENSQIHPDSLCTDLYILSEICIKITWSVSFIYITWRNSHNILHITLKSHLSFNNVSTHIITAWNVIFPGHMTFTAQVSGSIKGQIKVTGSISRESPTNQMNQSWHHRMSFG